MKRVSSINLSEQYFSIKEEIDCAISKVLRGGVYITGEECQKFEEEFSAFCNSKYAIGVASGTDALQLSLIASGVQRGDSVITVPNTAIPAVSAIRAANADVDFIDVEPETGLMSPDKLETFLKKVPDVSKIKAIIPVHLYGNMVDMDPVLEIAGRYGIKVIEDACHAHGALYREKPAGSMGIAGCFSFYPTKNLGCYGDGGIVVTNDEMIADKIRLLKNYGIRDKYYNITDGYNSRLDELQAAVLRVKLKYLNRWNDLRCEHALVYEELLKNIDIILPVRKEYAKHVFHQYGVRLRDRDKLKIHLEKHGIVTDIHYPVPIHLQKALRDRGYKEGDFPIAEAHCREVLSLPVAPELKKSDVEYVCSVIKSFF